MHVLCCLWLLCPDAVMDSVTVAFQTSLEHDPLAPLVVGVPLWAAVVFCVSAMQVL